MKGQVNVSYAYRPDSDKPYKAELEAMLPMDDEGLLVLELRSRDKSFFGEVLTSTWGYETNRDDGFRVRSKALAAVSWTELVEQCREYVNEQMTVLRSVYEHNQEQIDEQPSDETYEFEVGEFILGKLI